MADGDNSFRFNLLDLASPPSLDWLGKARRSPLTLSGERIVVFPKAALRRINGLSPLLSDRSHALEGNIIRLSWPQFADFAFTYLARQQSSQKSFYHMAYCGWAGVRLCALIKYTASDPTIQIAWHHPNDIIW